MKVEFTTKIQLNIVIGDKEILLTEEEARMLYTQLERLFGKRQEEDVMRLRTSLPTPLPKMTAMRF